MKYFDRWSFVHFGSGALIVLASFNFLGWLSVLLAFALEVLAYVVYF